MPKHKKRYLKKYSPDHVNYIRQFAYTFDDGSIDLHKATSKQNRDKLRQEQRSRGYDVVLDILEKNPDYFNLIDEGIYGYARENNHPELGVTVNGLYKTRGIEHAKYLSQMIKWKSADDIYYSPTAKSMLFLNDFEDDRDYDRLSNALRIESIQRNTLDKWQRTSKTHDLKRHAFITGYRKAAHPDPTDKELLERLWDQGANAFDNLVETDDNYRDHFMKLTDVENEQRGKVTYIEQQERENEHYLNTPTEHSVSHTNTRPQQQSRTTTPPLPPRPKADNLSLQDAAMTYANGWYDGAEKTLEPGLCRMHAELIMRDGIEAFKQRVSDPSDRKEPLPKNLVDYVGYDTYSLKGRTEDSIQLDGQIHFASINNPDLFDELTLQGEYSLDELDTPNEPNLA